MFLKDTIASTMNALALVLIVLCVLTVGPLLVIWSLNTLFHTNIEFSLATWAAVTVLSMAAGRFTIKGKKE